MRTGSPARLTEVLPLEPEFKQQMLESRDLEARLEQLGCSSSQPASSIRWRFADNLAHGNGDS